MKHGLAWKAVNKHRSGKLVPVFVPTIHGMMVEFYMKIPSGRALFRVIHDGSI